MPDFAKMVLFLIFLIFLILALGIVGEMDYQDRKREQLLKESISCDITKNLCWNTEQIHKFCEQGDCRHVIAISQDKILRRTDK